MADLKLFDASTQILRDSLSGLSRRQQLIANNLANLDTPGYRPYDVPFEKVLEQETTSKTGQFALLVTARGHMDASESAVQSLALEREAAFQTDGNGVDVDYELSRLSETAIQYNTVTQLMSARLALMRAAVSEGRR